MSATYTFKLDYVGDASKFKLLPKIHKFTESEKFLRTFSAGLTAGLACRAPVNSSKPAQPPPQQHRRGRSPRRSPPFHTDKSGANKTGLKLEKV